MRTDKVPPTAVLVMKKLLQKLCFEVKTGRKGWQRQGATGALLSVWISARSFLPVQELYGMAQQHAKPEGLRMGKRQAASFCPNSHRSLGTEYKEQEYHYSLLKMPFSMRTTCFQKH